ncbi:MAG TPA: hypothetical protein VGB05_08265, partial [Pyrinomonadaceae bacterium]
MTADLEAGFGCGETVGINSGGFTSKSAARESVGQRACHGGQPERKDEKGAESGVFTGKPGRIEMSESQFERIRSITLKARRGRDE